MYFGAVQILHRVSSSQTAMQMSSFSPLPFYHGSMKTFTREVKPKETNVLNIGVEWISFFKRLSSSKPLYSPSWRFCAQLGWKCQVMPVQGLRAKAGAFNCFLICQFIPENFPRLCLRSFHKWNLKLNPAGERQGEIFEQENQPLWKRLSTSFSSAPITTYKCLCVPITLANVTLGTHFFCDN